MSQQQYEFSYGSTGSATGGQTGYTISSNEGAGVTRSSVSVLDGFKSGGQTYSAGESSGAQIYIAGGSGGLRGSTGGSTAQLYISGGGSGGSAGYSAGQQSFSQGGAGSYSAGGAGSYSAGGAGSYSAGGAGSYSAGGAGSYSAGGSASYAGGASIEASAFSQIEAAILKALTPIDISETEVITVNGQSGIWSNKSEVINWRGIIPITQYSINEDQNPEIIRKRTDQSLVYEQEIAVRYLRPPTPPPPGEITIRQEKNIPTPPAPPLIIRQQPPRPETPAPLIVREAPPHPPAQVGPKVITISGKRLPPPPRKVVIERLAPLPSKPQSVIIERWLPYNQQKRRVIFQRNNEPDAIVQKPKNVIIQWEAPQVSIKKEFKDLGIIRANPVDYVQKYGSSLRSSSDLPSFVREIRAPVGVVLAADHQASAIFELEGDVQALRLIDLDREGLSEYRSFLAQFGGSSASLSISGGGNAGWSGASASGGNSAGWSGGQSQSITISGGGNNAGWNGGSQSITVSGGGSSLITELLSGTTRSSSGKLSLNDAQRVYYSLNGRLGRNTSDDSARSFFQALDKNGDGVIDVEEFQQALISLA